MANLAFVHYYSTLKQVLINMIFREIHRPNILYNENTFPDDKLREINFLDKNVLR